MANNVIAQVLGGSKKVLDDVETVGDVRAELELSSNYKASVDGDLVDDDFEVVDGNYVSFTEAVKGA